MIKLKVYNDNNNTNNSLELNTNTRVTTSVCIIVKQNAETFVSINELWAETVYRYV